MPRLGFLAVVAAGFLLAGCASSPLTSSQLRSGDAVVTMLDGGVCADSVGCPAPVLPVQQGRVLTGVSSEVELSLALVPSVDVMLREDAELGTWEWDTTGVPSGTYLATVVVSGSVAQVVLTVP